MGEPAKTSSQGQRLSGSSVSRKPAAFLAQSQSKDFAVSKLSLLHRVSAAYRSGKGGFKTPKYQNTYRLSAYNPFKCEVVDKVLEEVMTTSLNGIQYNPMVCMKMCQDMSMEVRNRIYKKDFDRCKYVITISIIQKAGQSINIGHSRLWDIERDNYSTFLYETPQFYAYGAVFGLYYE